MPQLPWFQDEAHDDPAGPHFSGQYAGQPPRFEGTLTVVTYNINFGRAVDQAIEDFRAHEHLQRADIILLQEMDEIGTEHIAWELQHNYVYYPATIARHGRNFGNAVLSPWPIGQGSKLILPGYHPINGQIRIAVQATVRVDDLDVAAYSVHTETPTVLAAYRQKQVRAIVDDIGRGESPVVVGGDFNTVSRGGIQQMVEQFARVGLSRTSAGAGATIAKLGIRPSAADHIFTRGFRKIAGGKAEAARASDHFPVWVELALP